MGNAAKAINRGTWHVTYCTRARTHHLIGRQGHTHYAKAYTHSTYSTAAATQAPSRSHSHAIRRTGQNETDGSMMSMVFIPEPTPSYYISFLFFLLTCHTATLHRTLLLFSSIEGPSVHIMILIPYRISRRHCGLSVVLPRFESPVPEAVERKTMRNFQNVKHCFIAAACTEPYVALDA